MRNMLPYPFDYAFEHGHSIDYKCYEGKDHRFVEKLGFISKMNSDCSYSAPGLNGLSLSSYGDWGTLHTQWADATSQKAFLDMYEQGLIKLWRIRAYLPNEKGEVQCYDYEEGNGWKTYDKEAEKWSQCEDPFMREIRNKIE